MKKLVLTLVAAVFLGSFFTTVNASTAPDEISKKCCRKMRREVKRALDGPSFASLKPDCYEEVTLYCVVNNDNQLEVFKLEGEDEALMEYIKKAINEEEIEVMANLTGKVFKFDLDFHHQP